MNSKTLGILGILMTISIIIIGIIGVIQTEQIKNQNKKLISQNNNLLNN